MAEVKTYRLDDCVSMLIGQRREAVHPVAAHCKRRRPVAKEGLSLDSICLGDIVRGALTQ